MGVSKVEYGGSTLIDLTSDTIIASALLEGYTAHGADGEPIIGTATGGSGETLMVRGTFDCGSSGATYVDVEFDTPLSATPTLIVFWEATTTYASTARTKGGFGMTERIAHYGTSGATTYYQRRWYGSTSNSMSSGSSYYPITSSSGQCIRNATSSGFRCYYYSNSYKLYGTFNYLAIVAPTA